MLVSYPFLILILGGLLAGSSAVWLRRGADVFGAWLEIPSLLAALAAAAAFAWAFVWAWTLTTKPPASSVGRAVPGLALAFCGGILTGWGLRVRGWKPRRVWRPERDEAARPYRTIRRPIALGLIIVAVGVAVLSEVPAVWVWLGATVAAWSVILELADWEQRKRLPACADYMRRTPRYLPLRRLFKRD